MRAGQGRPVQRKRLVTAYTVLMLIFPVLRFTRRRLSSMAWAAPGKSRPVTVQTLIRRI